MPLKNKGPSFYAVRRGKVPGIYSTWPECEAQTKGFTDAAYKKFRTLREAEAFISGASSSGSSNSVTSEAPLLSDTNPKKRAFAPGVDDVTGWDIVYSDGACKGNGKVGSIAGVGVWWGHNDPRNIAERCPGDQTNNRAELIAILRVLEDTPRTRTPLLIRTDSQYSINCFKKWIVNWRNNGWKATNGNPVKNAGIIRCVSAHLDIRGKMGQKVLLEYVKGHSGDTGNDGADLMANIGATLPIADERPWDEIEKQLIQEFSNIIPQPNIPVAELTVLAHDLDEDITNTTAIEAPAKIRKISAKDSPLLKAESVSPPVTDSEKIPSRSYHQSKSMETKFPGSSSTLHPIRIPTSDRLESPCSSTSPSPIDQISPQHLVSSDTPKFNAVLPANSSKDGTTTASTPIFQRPISTLPYIAGAQSPLKVVYAQPPLVPVRVEDVNLDDYADCLLEDDDIANELLPE